MYSFIKYSNSPKFPIVIAKLAQAAIISVFGFLDIIHDFIIFDWWIKKICRHNQYFAIGMGDYTNPNDYSQFYKEVCKYVIDNYEFVDGKGIMFIYYKE